MTTATLSFRNLGSRQTWEARNLEFRFDIHIPRGRSSVGGLQMTVLVTGRQASAGSSPLIDPFGRTIDYVRVS
ncbi:MAG TPA: hypothetical protein VF633_04225, partial [Brevundimonas sp.]